MLVFFTAHVALRNSGVMHIAHIGGAYRGVDLSKINFDLLLLAHLKELRN